VTAVQRVVLHGGPTRAGCGPPPPRRLRRGLDSKLGGGGHGSAAPACAARREVVGGGRAWWARRLLEEGLHPRGIRRKREGSAILACSSRKPLQRFLLKKLPPGCDPFFTVTGADGLTPLDAAFYLGSTNRCCILFREYKKESELVVECT
jgi:hypothetical protein